jgi:sporulation protein YlmC with PRC-barrel domain
MTKMSSLMLSDKKVLDTEGGEMGVLHNIVADGGTGILTELVVKPAAELDTSKFKTDEGYLFIPFDTVTAIKDVIVVDIKLVREQLRAASAQKSVDF